MKAIILTLSLIALCTCNTGFLRQLNTLGEIDTVTFPACATTTAADLPTFTVKTTAAYAQTDEKSAVTTLHTGSGSATTNDLTYNCVIPKISDPTGQTAEVVTGTCTKGATPGTPIAGEYIINKMVVGGDDYIVTGLSSTKFIIQQDITFPAASQTAFQKVNSTSDDKKTFTITMGETHATLPKFYTNGTTVKEITCVADTTDAKKVICTPTSTQMTKNTNYTIQYNKLCDAATTYTSTGVVVGFDLSETSASSFRSLSKLALLLGIFLF